MAQSLYDRIGGAAAVMAAVDIFYQKVLADPVTAPYFKDLDMQALVKKQVSFMTWAFGGPDEYKGRPLREAHGDLVKKGLSDQHFDAVATHLVATLKELDVEQSLIDEAVAKIVPTRKDVLGR
jgi:hemoglobin